MEDLEEKAERHANDWRVYAIENYAWKDETIEECAIQRKDAYKTGYLQGLKDAWCIDKNQLLKPFIPGTYVIIYYNYMKKLSSEIIVVDESKIGIPFCNLFSNFCSVAQIYAYTNID